MKPALTPEEWAEGWDLDDHPEEARGEPYGWQPGEGARVWTNNGGTIVYVGDRNQSESEDGGQVARIKGSGHMHAVAAFCGHRQPWWFTHEMIDAIRECAAVAKKSEDVMVGITIDRDADLAEQAADRIAALLPPEDS